VSAHVVPDEPTQPVPPLFLATPLSSDDASHRWEMRKFYIFGCSLATLVLVAIGVAVALVFLLGDGIMGGQAITVLKRRARQPVDSPTFEPDTEPTVPSNDAIRPTPFVSSPPPQLGGPFPSTTIPTFPVAVPSTNIPPQPTPPSIPDPSPFVEPTWPNPPPTRNPSPLVEPTWPDPSPIRDPTPFVQPTPTPRPTYPPPTTPEPVEEPSTTPEPVKEPSATPEPIEDPPTTPEPVEEPPEERPVEDPQEEKPVEEPPQEEPVEEPVEEPTNVDSPVY